ncbi:TetR/AcrR family transcriptional regulator [Microbacterium phosphatis]|uniref:TetR/AcrR family transcriptional regulator n=1 Tax=Microbacterium phosphatis TaxID=3140248 RepID=UPI003140A42C
MTADARESLVEAARELYADNGVAATTPRQVLARSGVGQGSLYHHFPSKRDLAVAAVTRTVDRALAAGIEDLRGPAAPRRRIVSYLERPRDAVRGCRVGRLTSDPMVMADEDLAKAVADYFGDLIEEVAAVFAEDGLPPGEARDRGVAAVAIIQGGYVLSRATQDPEMMRSAVRGFLGLLGER